MKRLTLTLLLLSVSALSFGIGANGEFYRKNRQFAFSAGLNDPLYKFIREVEGAFYAGTGTIYYVDSNVGNEGDGKSWEGAKDTINEAVDLCTANNGDVILVAQGHAETIASAGALDIDVAGLTIIGCGRGDERPTITIGATSVATADIDIDAANVTLVNLRFAITAANVTVMIDVNADAFIMDNCFVEMHADETSDMEAVTAIDINGGAANACDNVQILNTVFHAYKGTAAGSTQAIELGEVQDGILIEGCTIIGDFTNAGIHNPTGKVLTNLVVKDCIIENKQTGDHCIELVSACTGFLVRNYYKGDTDAALVDPGSCFSFECYGADTVDTSGFLLPAAGAAT